MTRVRWRLLPEERTVTYSPAWLQPFDLLTGGAPVQRLQIALDLLRDGAWQPTDIQAVLTPDGAVTYPGLGHRREPAITPVQRCRVRFEAEGYSPLYRVRRDGVEFDAYPYNETNPPAQGARLRRVALGPSVRYRFSANVPALYGTIVTQSGTPVPDAYVRAHPAVGGVVRTVSDHNGAFALPLRWASTTADTVVQAFDRRSQPPRSGARSVRLPGALGRNQEIEIQ
jgi:hypothetical protein